MKKVVGQHWWEFFSLSVAQEARAAVAGCGQGKTLKVRPRERIEARLRGNAADAGRGGREEVDG